MAMFVSFGFELVVEGKEIFFKISFKKLNIRFFPFSFFKLFPTTKNIFNTNNLGE